MWKASTGLQEDTYLLYSKDYTCTLFQKYFSINQCNNFYRIIKEEEKWIGAGITSILWSSLVHFCSFLLTLLTLLLLKIQEEKSLGFKRYLNQQAIILNYLYNYCIYCGFLQIHQGSFDICAPNITYFSEKGQTNESFAITKPQPEVEQAFIRCNQVDFLYEAS